MAIQKRNLFSCLFPILILITTSGAQTANSTVNSVGFCDCVVLQPTHTPVPGWAATTGAPRATIVYTVNNATNQTSTSIIGDQELLATDIGNGTKVFSVTVTQITAITPTVGTTVFTTVITSPSTYDYTDYYLEIPSETLALDNLQQTVCDTVNDVPTFFIPWIPPVKTSPDRKPYTTAYPELTACTGFGFSVVGSDVGAQTALVGGVTISQFSYIFDDTVPGADMLQPTPAPAGGNIQTTTTVPPPQDSPSPAPQPPSTPSVPAPIETPSSPSPQPTPDIPAQSLSNPPAPDILPSSSPSAAVPSTPSPEVVMPSSTNIFPDSPIPNSAGPAPAQITNEIVSLPGGSAVTANPDGDFVLGSSTFTPVSGTVEIVMGSSTKSLAVVTQTHVQGTATPSIIEVTGGSVRVSYEPRLWGIECLSGAIGLVGWLLF